MNDLETWLKGLGLDGYSETFRSHDVDLEVAPDLTEADLEKLGLSLGNRRKFLAAAAKLRKDSAPRAAAPPDLGERAAETLVERRPVTVLFADLVGSTALASRLDPEDMGRLLREYREACGAAIARYDGHVAQYLGDGILAYFGYPQAQEHAAERAVRAGLEIVERIARLRRPDGEPLQSRVGIATGTVVAGAAGADPERTVVGETPNLAARLQALAEPGAVVVSAATHHLTGDFFEFVFAGEHAAKGYAQPVPAWRALGESGIESRFAAARAAVAGPIVGRERELAFLSDAWRRAKDGGGHVVLLSGEAGMGKSRLLEALAERVRDEPHRLLRAQCSPYHGQSALHPFTELLRHRLGVRRDLPAEENLRRIDAMLGRIERASRQARLLLAELLEVEIDDALSQAELTPAQRRNETLAVLEAFLLAPLDGATVLLLLEDAHWSDPTTQALVDRLLARIERTQALVAITHRPELRTSWADHPQATLLRCKPLGAEQCAALVQQVASRRHIEESLLREIAARSDGVPLYAEELTKAVLDVAPGRAKAVPLTLQDSLMARLDRLGAAREVAQVASVIGRQFPHRLIASVARTPEPELRRALEQLREAGVVFSAGQADDTVYSFNHALVQEAAYESLSRGRRQALHAAIGRALEPLAAAGETDPALVAHHFSSAGEPEKSFGFRLLAADRAGNRLAFTEARASLEAALDEAGRVADAGQRARMKTEAQLKLGSTLVLQLGPQSPQAESALAAAYKLAQESDAGAQLFEATWGLYLNAARNRRFERAAQLGSELLEISERLGDDDLKFEALHHRWGLAYFLGQSGRVIEYTTQGTQRYDRGRHHRFSYTYAGHDPGVCAHSVKSGTLGLRGEPREAADSLEAALALAESLEHPITLVFAHFNVCQVPMYRGDAAECDACATRLIETAQRYDFPAFRQSGAFWQGVAHALQGEYLPALRLMEPAFGAIYGIGFLGVLPGALLAEALAGGGRGGDALALIARLLEESGTPETGVHISELWRLRGQLLQREDMQQAERCLRTALRIACEQEAKIYLLRSAMSLARLLAETGRREEARAALAGATADGPADPEVPEIATLRSLIGAL